MGKTHEITLLFDSYSAESANLYASFVNSGIEVNAVSVEDNGFLPQEIVSVYGFFLKDGDESLQGRPKFFNEIKIPDYWQIEGNNTSAKVLNHAQEKARIFYYKPSGKRIVSVVDWLDDKGVVRLCNHYDKFGNIFCKTILNKSGQRVMRRFFTPYGEERIVESFVTGDILLKYKGRDHIFKNKTEFVRFFLKCKGLDKTALYYNSLSYPFFASQSLEANGFKDVLFWNEPIKDSIPGNMLSILNNQATRTKVIYVQRKEAYERLISLGASKEIVKSLGYVYSFIRNNKHRKDMLICTNSDQLLHFDEIAKLVPDANFHVAALTEMSSKLLSVGANKNVFLYPNIKPDMLDKLFKKCDFYLDINRESEIVDAVHRAFLNNQLIVGFDETMHNSYYTAPTNTFPECEFKDMAEALNVALKMPKLIDEALVMQRDYALSEDKDRYINIFKK